MTKKSVMVKIVKVTSSTAGNGKLMERWHLRIGLTDFIVSAYKESAAIDYGRGREGTDVWMHNPDISDVAGESCGSCLSDCSSSSWDITEAIEMFIKHQFGATKARWTSQHGLDYMEFEADVDAE